MSVVNGYYCANCSEVLLAKRGIDPHQGPIRAELNADQERRATPLGQNAPEPGRAVGGRLNLYA